MLPWGSVEKAAEPLDDLLRAAPVGAVLGGAVYLAAGTGGAAGRWIEEGIGAGVESGRVGGRRAAAPIPGRARRASSE